MSKRKKLLLVLGIIVLTTGTGCSVVEDVQDSLTNPNSSLQQTVNRVEPVVDGATELVAIVPPNPYTTPVLLGLALVSGVINLIQKQAKAKLNQNLVRTESYATSERKRAEANYKSFNEEWLLRDTTEKTLKAVVNAIEVFEDVTDIKEEVAERLAEDTTVNTLKAKALITSVKETL